MKMFHQTEVKMSADRLNKLAEKIISLLIFEERFEHILEEIPDFKKSHVADELKLLISKDYVRPCRDLENESKSGVIYDSDKMIDYSFTLTSKGLNYLEAFIK